MNKKSLKVNKSSIFFLLLMLPYLEPLGFKEEILGTSIIDNIYTIVKLSVFICLILYVIYKSRISKMFICQAGWAVTLLFSTLLNNSGFDGFKMYAGPALSPMAVILIFDIFRDKLKICVNILSKLFVVYCLINFLTFINQYYLVYHGNMRDGAGMYFFSIDNRFIFYFLPSIACVLFSSYVNVHRTMTWVMFFLMIHAEFMLVTLWSAGAMIVMAFVILWICIIYHFINTQIFNIRNYFIFIMGFNLLMYITALCKPMNIWFRGLAESLFHKGSNLNDRFVMWQNAAGYLAESPFFGEGIKPIEYNYLRFNVGHAHNLFMDVTFKGGVLSLFFFFGVLYFALKPLYKYRNTVLSKQISFLVLMGFVLSLADTYSDALFYILLCLSYHLEVFLDKSDRKQQSAVDSC